MKSYKVHGNIVLYLLIDQVPVLTPGSRVSVRSVSSVHYSLSVLLLSLTVFEWRKCELCAIWLCLQLCSPQLCHQHHVCLFVLHMLFFEVQEIFSLLVVWSPVKLSELFCKDLFWMWVTPQYLLGSQLMAPEHADAGIRCNVTPIMNNVYTRMQEPQICSSALHSQPVFHLPLEALKRGWKLDPLDIPVAWMFSLQRTSTTVPHLERTAYFSSCPSLSTQSDAVSTTFWPFINVELRKRCDIALCCGHVCCHGSENSGKQAAWAS